MTRALALLALASGAACLGPLVGPVDVEVVTRGPGVDAEHELAVVTLESPTDLLRGDGELFRIRAGQSLYALPDKSPEELDEATPEEIFEQTRGEGSLPNPDVFLDDGVVRAREHDSLMYLSSFAHLETAMRFFSETLDRPSTATTRPPDVAFYGGIVLSPDVPVPVNLADNAAYYPPADGFFVVPTVLQSEGVAPFLDPGVAVHELSHRVFSHRVMHAGDALAEWKRFLFFAVYDQSGQVPAGFISTRNAWLGLEEGIADLNAIGFLEDPSFLRDVLPPAAELRSLEGPLPAVATFRDVVDGNLPDDLADGCRVSPDGNNLANPSFNYYCLGTLLASAFWEACDRDATVLREEMLPRVQDGLDLLRDAVSARSIAAGELTFRTEDALDAFVRALDGHPLQVELCAAFANTHPSLLDAGGVPSCP